MLEGINMPIGFYRATPTAALSNCSALGDLGIKSAGKESGCLVYSLLITCNF